MMSSSATNNNSAPKEATDSSLLTFEMSGKVDDFMSRARSPNAVFEEICGPSPSNNNNSSPLVDVDELLLDKTTISDVDELLQDKPEEEAVHFMRHMVADLLNEVEVLKIKLEESQQEVSTLKKQQLRTTLNKADYNRNRDRHIISPRGGRNTKVSLSVEQAQKMSIHDASCMTIANLTKKVEDLNYVVDEVTDERNTLVERVDDLTCQNSAYEVKIAALELQFKAINRTRQKAVQRLISGSDSGSSPSKQQQSQFHFEEEQDSDETPPCPDE